MKQTPSSKFHLISAAAAIVICFPCLHAGTTNATFSFQQGDLQKDGSAYGSASGYTGVLDGHIQDPNTTGVLTSGVALTIGNQFQTGAPNARNFVGLFSYDLTELNSFIAANTSASSSVSITSVSFKLIASGNTSGTSNGGIGLYRTDPFTSGATWPTTDGSTAWSSPYQNLAPPNDTVQFGYTGGGSALTADLGTASPTTASKTAGSPLEWTSSANFVAALEYALAQPSKKLYLMAARTTLGNADGRVPVNSSTTTTVDNRPELVVTVAVSTLSDWTGATSTSWATAGNWTSAPGTGDNVRFNNSSTANLATVLNQDFNLNGITLTSPTGPVSISGANSLTLGVGGLDLSAATQDLTITAPLVLGAAQIWNINTGRNLGVSGTVTGSGDLTLFGNGKVSLGASNILPNGASAGNLVVSATLDLNGTSQSINGLSGAGVVDNTAGGAVTLTLGNNDAAGNFSGTIQDTGGNLSLVKSGSGNQTLSGANSFAGGFTNNGSGNVVPNNNLAFGTGPVVSNAGQLYATATTIFANTLALNNSTLRIGGANNRTITWNGPVTATGTSGLSADNGTSGITLGSTLNIAGATFTSFANGTAHNINGDISGAAGNLNVTSGTLQLSGIGSYTGTTTLSGSGILRLQPTGTISNSTNVVINGSGNFNIRNTVGWVYSGTITGDDTGSININSGTDAELAGPISGVLNINVNSSGTDTTISGNISGITNVNVQDSMAPILRLGGNNSYSGNTTIANTATLVLESANALPNASPLSIANGNLSATVAGTDDAGPLNVTGTATINLAGSAALAFADSSGVGGGLWAGTLDLTGTFVSGVSLKFGTTAAGLTDDQLLKITATGFTGFDLDADGFLIATPAGSPYDTWKSQITNGLNLRTDDADGDGFNNLQEFLFGTSPIASTGSLVTTTTGSGNMVLRWLQRETGSTYTLKQSSTLGVGSWATAPQSPAIDGDQTGAPTDYDYFKVTLPIGSGKLFYRVEGVEN